MKIQLLITSDRGSIIIVFCLGFVMLGFISDLSVNGSDKKEIERAF
jgi:hypothetical protein